MTSAPGKGAENIEKVRRMLGAFNQGDMATALEFAHPDLTYYVRGEAPISGKYDGAEAMQRVLEKVWELTGGTMVATPEVIMADDDNVMMYMRVQGSRPDGRNYDSHQAYLYRLRDGKCWEGQTIPVDQKAFTEFMS